MKEHRGISRAVRLINSILDNGLVLLLLLGLAYGCYALWDSQNLAQEATAEQYAVYKPQEDTLGFAELQALNEDVIGWITVYGTPIDYPVVQGEDNWEYINKSAEGTYSLTGAIFADASCDPDFQDFNTILYGHNMVPNVMFGSIKEFKEQSFFDSHPYGNMYIQNRDYGLEIFGLLEADAYDSSIFQTGVREAGRQSYLEAIRGHAVYLRDLVLADDDRIVLLSTCPPTEGIFWWRDSQIRSMKTLMRWRIRRSRITDQQTRQKAGEIFCPAGRPHYFYCCLCLH